MKKHVKVTRDRNGLITSAEVEDDSAKIIAQEVAVAVVNALRGSSVRESAADVSFGATARLVREVATSMKHQFRSALLAALESGRVEIDGRVFQVQRATPALHRTPRFAVNKHK